MTENDISEDLARMPFMDSSLEPERRVEDLLGRMTLEEKCSLCSGRWWTFFYTKPVKRLGIKAFKTTDGPHGVGLDGTFLQYKATYFPPGICRCATWNPDLSEAFGRALAREVRDIGYHMILGPGVNIHRSPLCGRTFEYQTEDPFLNAALAVRAVKGIQSQGIAACAKHFAANNQETRRTEVSSEVSQRALREIYLPAFEAVVREAGVWSVMGAYNKLNGVYCCENEALLRDLLIEEWGFDGFVVSDWWATYQKGDTARALRAGLSLEMPWASRYSPWRIKRAIGLGLVPKSTLDDNVKRLLRVMFRVGLFDGNCPTNPPRTTLRAQPGDARHEQPSNARPEQPSNAHPEQPGNVHQEELSHVCPEGVSNARPEQPSNARHEQPNHVHQRQRSNARDEAQQVARAIAEEGMVLLKNEHPEGQGALLPLDLDQLKKLAVLGPNADKKTAFWGGSSAIRPRYEVTPLEGIKQKCRGRVALVRSPAEADVAVVVVGLSHRFGNDSEFRDRTRLELPDDQVELIRRTVRANPKTVVVLINGSPVSMEGWIDEVPAVLEAWYGGLEAGNAIADILFGHINPSGKLPITYPRKLSDSPAHTSMRTFPGDEQVFYDEGIFVGYRHFDTHEIEPLFPFGHGLSYTTFVYKDLRLSADHVRGEERLEVSLEVSLEVLNSGSRAGAEVVQLYVQDVEASVARPLKELKGFRKVRLEPGEAQAVTFEVSKRDLSFFDEGIGAWRAEAGLFRLLVGSSSRDIRLVGEFEYLG